MNHPQLCPVAVDDKKKETANFEVLAAVTPRVALFHLPRLRLSPIFRPRPIRRLQTPRLNHQPSLEPAIRAAVQAFVIDLFDTFKQAFFRPLVSTIYRAFDLAIWVTKSLDKALFVAFEQA